MKHLVPLETIERKIIMIRGHKVMLDRDLAAIYDVETRALNQAITRNARRFPPDFMFKLTNREAALLVSQNVIPHMKYLGGHLPHAFTEQGVAMLSSVLNSERAIDVNILIMRAFVRLREFLGSHRELARRMAELENKYDAQFKTVFDAIRLLMSSSGRDPKPVPGFKPENSRKG